jgi:molybdopterin-guanine dinucleotide biosynthesis protein A
MNIDAFILVGGASSRMGLDKAALTFRGTTLGGRAGRVLREIAVRVSAVGGVVEGFPAVPDLLGPAPDGRRGAIYGVHAALANCKPEWAAVLACDLPFVGAELFRRLIERAAAHPGCDAVVPRQADGQLQPLAAIYRTGPCLSAVENSIRNAELRLTEFLSKIEVQYLEPDAYADLNAKERLFTNVNTPEDYLMLSAAGDASTPNLSS